jgi:replicative DNA helicase
MRGQRRNNLPSNELFNEEAENHVLAAILQNPEEYHVVVGSTGLRGSDFVGVESRRIATAIDEVVSERKQPTLPYIIEALRLRGESDTVDYVSRLTSLPCSIDQAIGYANAVRSLSVSRQLGNVGAKIITISREKRTNVEEALTEAESALRKSVRQTPRISSHG